MPNYPSGLTFFTVVRTIHTKGDLTADVRFDAQVGRGVTLQAEIPPPGFLEVLSAPVWARLLNGVLVDESGGAGVELISAEQIPDGFTWTAEFSNPRLDGFPVRNGLASLLFEARPNGVTFDLKDAEVYAPRSREPWHRGRFGYGIDDIAVDDGLLTITRGDGEELPPVAIPESNTLAVAYSLTFGR